MEKNELQMDITTLYNGLVELLDEAIDIFDDCEEGTTQYAYTQAQVETLELLKDSIESGSF